MALRCILIVFKWIKKQFVSVIGQVWHCVACLIVFKWIKKQSISVTICEDLQLVYIVYIQYIELRNNLSLSQVKTCMLPSIIRAGGRGPS